MRRAHLSEPGVTPALLRELAACSLPLRGEADLEPLIDRIGSARCVLLGEASHGTAEFYRWRTRISRRLIEEHGFSFIAVEGDWPDCRRVDRYVRELEGESARAALAAFRRWPTWMWANEEVVELIEWLRAHDAAREPDRRAGFHGLDVYSLWDSLYRVMAYVQRKDPSAVAAARRALHCFEPYGEDEQQYAWATRFVGASCESEVVALLREVRAVALQSATASEDSFDAEQNATVLMNAEAYYRAMVRGGPSSWNVRDRHMDQTLGRLMQEYGAGAKGIVWAHNTHVGDANFTDMVDDGLVNLGSLARERFGAQDVALVGFASYAGSVIAGREWGEPLERMTVPPAREGSWDHALHSLGPSDQMLIFPRGVAPPPELMTRHGQRAIGVVYRPEHEHLGNYVPTALARRYDALIHCEATEALHPLAAASRVESERGDVPETWPSGV